MSEQSKHCESYTLQAGYTYRQLAAMAREQNIKYYGK